MSGERSPAKVVPYLLQRAQEMCPRRLRLAFQNQGGDSGAFLRFRVRDAVLEDAMVAHRELAEPDPACFRVRDHLLPEEQALQQRAVGHYLELFAGQPVKAVDDDQYRRPVERQGVLVGGTIDLPCEGPSGERELRQFQLWGGTLDPDPRSNATFLLATLRLSRWVGAKPLRIRHADLVAGRVEELTVDLASEKGDLVALYEQRIARIRVRTSQKEAVPGEFCTACPYVAGCPAYS